MLGDSLETLTLGPRLYPMRYGVPLLLSRPQAKQSHPLSSLSHSSSQLPHLYNYSLTRRTGLDESSAPSPRAPTLVSPRLPCGERPPCSAQPPQAVAVALAGSMSAQQRVAKMPRASTATSYGQVCALGNAGCAHADDFQVIEYIQGQPKQKPRIGSIVAH